MPGRLLTKAEWPAVGPCKDDDQSTKESGGAHPKAMSVGFALVPKPVGSCWRAGKRKHTRSKTEPKCVVLNGPETDESNSLEPGRQVHIKKTGPMGLKLDACHSFSWAVLEWWSKRNYPGWKGYTSKLKPAKAKNWLLHGCHGPFPSISIHFQLGSDCQGFQVKLRRSGHQWDYDVRFFGDTMELEICPVHFRDFMFGLSCGTRPW